MASRAAIKRPPLTRTGETLIHLTLPPGTPAEAENAVRRLVELTAVLARRCAQLQEALETRIAIEQAKGILAERFGLPPDAAFDVLRHAARSNRVGLTDLAQRVITARKTPAEIAAQLQAPPLPRIAGNAARR